MTSAWTIFLGLKTSASLSEALVGDLDDAHVELEAAVAAGLGVAAGERVEHGGLAAPGKPDDRDLHGVMLPGAATGVPCPRLSTRRSGPRR